MVNCIYELVERLVDDFVYMNSCRLREIKKEKKTSRRNPAKLQ